MDVTDDYGRPLRFIDFLKKCWHDEATAKVHPVLRALLIAVGVPLGLAHGQLDIWRNRFRK